MPFIPLYLEQGLGIASEAQRGLYMAFFYFFGVMGYALFCPLWGTLSDRYGVKVMLLRGTFVTAFIFLLMGLVSNVWALIFLRFLTASCAGTTSACNILVAKYTPEQHQGFALGSLSTAFWSGSMLGNVLGGFVVEHFGYFAAFAACGLTYFLAGIAVLFVREDFRRGEVLPHSGQSVAAAGKPSAAGIFTFCVLTMLSFFILWNTASYMGVPYFAMLVQRLGGAEHAPSLTGIISSFAAVSSLLSGLIFGYLSDRMGSRRLALLALLGTGIMVVAQGVCGGIFMLGLYKTVQTFFSSGLQPVLLKNLSGITPQRARGTVLGWSSTCSNVGVMLSTLLSGGVIYFCDLRWVYIVSGILVLLMMPVVLPVLRRAEREKLIHRS
jgi:MFS family permease